MSLVPRILLVGTADTKSAEILFLRQCIEEAGGSAIILDVGVLGAPQFVTDIPNHVVAAEANCSLADLAASGDENFSISQMARGAARIAARLHACGEIDGMLALGGTMGTDLALDVAAVLPVGVPKVLLSTIAHSHLLPPERIPQDLMAILWAGGLHGLNRLCRASMLHAAGAVVGACRSAAAMDTSRPLVGMTSLGSSVLRYMKPLTAALEARGYEVAVFHTAGMGGQAFEALAAKGEFAAVLDFSLQELANDALGSCVTAGPDRLLGAGRASVPQIVAPGATDMVDFASSRDIPLAFADRAVHVHNRLVASAGTTAQERSELAQNIAQRLQEATGPTCLLLPVRGVDEWDRPGLPMHAPEGLHAFLVAMRSAAQDLTVVEVDAHINDDAFCAAALKVFDDWVDKGWIIRPAPRLQRKA